MVIDSVQMDLENLISNAENVKEIVLESLVREGLLGDDDATMFANTFSIIPIKKAWYKRMFTKNTDGWCLKIARIYTSDNES